MNHEQIEAALNEVQDRHIQEATRPKTKKRALWYSLAAAAAAIAIVISTLAPAPIRAQAVALADYPKQSVYINATDYKNQLNSFFVGSFAQFLGNTDGKNAAFSPMNLYFALAMLAETTNGATREQILRLLGDTPADQLAVQAQALWNASYRTGNNPCTLANSLWLNKGIPYSQETMDRLASYYYASVYQRDLNTAAAAKDLAAWVNNQTGRLLKDAASRESLPEDTQLLLASTISFQAKWSDEFSKSQNSQAVFHSPNADVTATYMNKERLTGVYYWGEDYGAITLSLKGGYTMWLILPDAGKAPADLLVSGAYTQLFLGGSGQTGEKNRKEMFINLSLPKFDFTSQADFRQGLEAMGVTDVFDEDKADFSAALPGIQGVCASGVNQATRVCIDEKGVTAAAYIEIPGAGAAQPPEDTVDFVLDRPFLFAVTGNSGLPLFAGVVQQP